MIDSTITGNEAIALEDGQFPTNGLSEGGGIWACSKGGGEFFVNRSTIDDNKAEHGGGLWLGADVMPTYTLNAELVNSTFSKNLAIEEENPSIGSLAEDAQGGGIWIGVGFASNEHSPNRGSVDVEFLFTTVTNNTSLNGGGIHTENAPTQVTSKFDNSIVSGNFASKEPTSPEFLDSNNVNGPLVSVSEYNLFGSNNGSFAGLPPATNPNFYDDDPGLLPLAYNGGLTATHMPMITSIVIDAGDPNAAAGVGQTPEFDQRGDGYSRVVDIPGVGMSSGEHVDIGAYELQGLPGPRVTDVKIIKDAAPNSPAEERSYFELVNQLNLYPGDQVRPLPFEGFNRIKITYSEPVDVNGGGQLKLTSIRTGTNYKVLDGGHNPAKTEYQWTLHPDNPTLPRLDQVLLRLDTSINRIESIADDTLLDGDWINPISITTDVNSYLISEFPSGDGVEGGDFRFVFTTEFFGDYNNDGIVGQADLDLVTLNWSDPDSTQALMAIAGWINLPTSEPDGQIGQAELDEVLQNWGNLGLAELFLWGDWNNDGFVGQEDLDLVLLNWGADEDTVAEFYEAIWSDPDSIIGQGELDGVLLNWGLWFNTNLRPSAKP